MCAGVSNGIQKVWLDGALVDDRRSITFRAGFDAAVEKFTFRNFHGGSNDLYRPPQTQWQWCAPPAAAQVLLMLPSSSNVRRPVMPAHPQMTTLCAMCWIAIHSVHDNFGIELAGLTIYECKLASAHLRPPLTLPLPLLSPTHPIQTLLQRLPAAQAQAPEAAPRFSILWTILALWLRCRLMKSPLLWPTS